MNNENLSKSIALIGPQGVGKSLISEKLKNKFQGNENQEYFLLKLDLIEKLCEDAFNGNLFISSFEKDIIFFNELRQINPQNPDYEKIKKALQKDFDNYYNEISVFNKHLHFASFEDIIKPYLDTINSSFPGISNESLLFLKQHTMLKILDLCTNKLDVPIILDAGADIGSLISYNKKDKQKLENILGIDAEKLDDYQNSVLSKFGNVIYLKPKETNAKNGNEHANSYYTKNQNSYKAFANSTIQVGDVIKNIEGYTPKPREEETFEDKFIKSQNLNETEINKVISEIEKISLANQQQPNQ